MPVQDVRAGLNRPNALEQGDYEVRVQVDFEKRLLRPLSVAGVSDEDALTSEILVYGWDRCHPDCATHGCRNCRPRKLYQDLAGNPGGAVAFVPHCEYLYCLRLHKRQPARAILSLTPREQNVEVKELGLLAYWFATWFQRAKADDRDGGRRWVADNAEVNAEEDENSPCTVTELVAQATAIAAAEGGITRWSKKIDTVAPADAPAAKTCHSCSNSTSKYLPNLRIIYQVKQERMTVTMPEPNQLTREIDVLLSKNDAPDASVQVATLRPGVSQASKELLATRDSSHTLMLKLRDLGSPLKLLDLVTEKKVLRVQESLMAPKHMNFLMERRVDQRGTFVLHITFDERGIEVENKWLGEFYLDVDFDKNTLNIGTVPGHEGVLYRVEELLGPNQSDLTKAQRVLWFQGGVDTSTLFIQEPVPIHTMASYLITVIYPDTRLELPTSVLCIGTKSLYVKEVKGSDVRLHVTVQRPFDPAEAISNASNCPDADTEFAGSPQFAPTAAQQGDPTDASAHCPIVSGCTRYRILHNAGGSADSAAAATAASGISRTPPSDAVADEAPAAADDSWHSSVGCGSCDDSGLGRNPSSRSESLDSLAAQCQLRRRLYRHGTPEHSEEEEEHGQQRQPDFNVNLDVDLPNLQARLLPGGVGISSGGGGGGGCYLIVEDSLSDGRSRSIPCQLGQSFGVQRWCRYTVKAIGDTHVTALFTFRLTDTDVTDIKPCNPTVRLSKNVSHR